MNSLKSYGQQKDDLQAASVSNLPEDTISDIAIGNNMVAVGSWDASVRVYSKSGTVLNPAVLFDNLGAPVTSVCIINDAMVVAGLVDGNMVVLDINNTQNKKVVKAHEGIIKKIFFYNNAYIITVAFDGFYKIWDNTFKEVHSNNCNGKIYCMDLKDGHMALGLNNKKVFYVDLNTNFTQEIPTKMEYAIRSISILNSNNNVDICVGGVEGKVDLINVKTQSTVSLRLHRADDKLYSVNSCALLNDKLVVTAGSDGVIYINDRISRFKVATSRYDKPITALAVKGREIIFALGDDWSKGFTPQNIKPELMIADIGKYF